MEPLGWSHRIVDVGRERRDFRHIATEEERTAVANALEIPACRSLVSEYAVTPRAKGRFIVRGRVCAELDQLCVVSVELLEAQLNVEFEIEFWPSEQFEDVLEVDLDDPEKEDPEPIENGRIGIGRLIYEVLASNLELYPRKPGEELPEVSPPDDDADVAGSGAFAKLAMLKSRD